MLGWMGSWIIYEKWNIRNRRNVRRGGRRGACKWYRWTKNRFRLIFSNFI